MNPTKNRSKKILLLGILLSMLVTVGCLLGTQDSYAGTAEAEASGALKTGTSVFLPEENAIGRSPSLKKITLPEITINGGKLAGSDTLLRGYLRQQGLEAATGEAHTGKATRGSMLTSHNKLVYDRLKEMIIKVAAGEQADATVSIPLEDFGIENSYTAEELGVPSIIDSSGNVTEAAVSVINQKFQVTIEYVLYALLADCPYELYWYDKTVGLGFAPPSAALIGDSALVFERRASAKFTMTVASAYAKNPDAEDRFTADMQKTKAAAAAASHAGEIVNQYAGKTDEQKLRGYAGEIIALVDYDNDAAVNYGETEQYGDPWQVIYVFDQNPATNVVCEGYSKAYQYLCDLTAFSDPSVECNCMTGDMYAGKGDTPAGSGPHMWNTVKIGNRNYLVDVTNSDDNGGRSAGVPENGELILGGAKEYESSGYSGYQVEWGDDEWIVYFYDEQSVRTFTDEERILSDKSYAQRMAGEDKPGTGDSGTGGSGGETVTDQKITVTFRLTGADGTSWIPASKVTVAKDTTAGEVFEEVLEKNGYTFEGNRITEGPFKGGISYVKSITAPSGVTLKEKGRGSKSGWMFRINGTIVGTPLGTSLLQDGGSIDFFFTNDYEREFDGETGGETAKDIHAILEALPQAAGITLHDEEQIAKARKLYDAMSEEERAKVTPADLKKLTDAESRLAELKAARNNPQKGAAAGAKAKKPAATKIIKSKCGKKKVTLYWKKITRDNRGYQIRCSLRKSMKKSRILTITSPKITKKTITKLRSGKKYYFQIRSYNKVKGKKVCSKWSAKKALRIR